MKTIWLTEKKNIAGGVAMLLGGFDGLHVGHRRLLARAKESGFPVGIMTIAGGKEGNLFTFTERGSIFRACGVDFVFELPFAEIKNLTPEQFVRLLRTEFNPKVFVCGEDFRFGAGAVGTPENLKAGGQVCVEVLSLVELQGEKISSRKIKELLAQGRVEEANALLGEEFFLTGTVQKDRQIGRTIGFPTANITYPEGKVSIKKGVYHTEMVVDGKCYQGITNYGGRPTFDNAVITTETHLDKFAGDLYGKCLTVKFLRYLRDIQKFDSAQQLKEQLEKDMRRVRQYD